MFVIAGVTGNTGKVAAETLLSQGKPVRVLVRDAAKGESWKKRGAEVAVTDLDDVEALTNALKGADGAYLLLPPNFAFKNPRADNGKRTRALFEATEKAGVRHIVFLSSVGAQHEAGTGPIGAVHDAEKIFSASKANVTFIRAAYFMENAGNSLYALDAGAYPTFLRPDLKVPMVATRDIGLVAAKALAEGGKGRTVIELEGPQEYDQNDVAAALSRLTKKKVSVQHGPEDAMVPALTGAGFPQPWAELYREMTHGVNTGHVTFEGGAAQHVRGTTTLETVLEGLLAARK